MLETFYLNSSGSGPILRIGVMIDDDQLIGTYAAALEHIAASNFAKLSLVIRNGARGLPRAKQSYPMRVARVLGDKEQRGRYLYQKFQEWDLGRCEPAAKVHGAYDCGPLLADVPQIEVTPRQRGFVDRIPEEAIAEIKAHNLDVILRFGFRILRGDILNAAKHGVWSYHHGDGDRFRGGPPHYWELVEREPLSGAMLQVLNEKLDAGLVLIKTLAPTEFGMSIARNSVAPYVASEPFVIAKLHQLHEKGWEAVLASAPAKSEYKGRKEIYRSPSVVQFTGFLGRELAGKVSRRLTGGIGGGYWRIAIRRRGDAGTRPWQGDWSDFRWCGREGDFFADPQLIEHEGRTWLFFEHFDYAKCKGNISCAEILDDGSLGEPRIVLDPPYHLSMPFVFRHEGEIYMIPESCAAKRIDLFRAVEFPHRWEFDHTLLDKPGIDTVMHPGGDGGFYFFTSFRQRDEAHPNLFLFRASGLREPWKLHPANAISLDARYARNAGGIITLGGEHYRPSQDLTHFYGRQMHFHRIVRLNEREYVEEIAGQRAASPGWGRGVIGTHSYARTDTWEAIDGYLPVCPKRVA